MLSTACALPVVLTIGTHLHHRLYFGLHIFNGRVNSHQGALGEGELRPAVGAELLMEDEPGGLKQGASTRRTIGTQTEGAGRVTHLALDMVLENSAVDGRAVGAEVRYASAGAPLGAPRGARAAHN